MNANVDEIVMSCGNYRALVSQTIGIYLNQAFTVPTCRYHRIHMMVGLFTYLLTPEVKSFLNHEKSVNFRATVLQKIEGLLTESGTMYIDWPTRRRFTLALVNVRNYLLDPAYVPVRCSTRLVARSVGLLDTVLRSSDPDAYSSIKAAKAEIEWLYKRVSSLSAAETEPVSKPVSKPVTKPAPEPVRIKVKVLPRRSARLMARVSHQA
jgi:hypothetical protein